MRGSRFAAAMTALSEAAYISVRIAASIDLMHERRLGGAFAVTIATLALSLALCVGVAFARPGDLDTSFSGDGKLTTSFTGSVDGANDVAIQADGKIVVVGTVDITDGFAIARYNTDGTLDTSADITPATNFSVDGVTTIGAVTEGTFAEALAVAIQPGDQKIVVAGGGYNNDFADESEDFALARLNTDGSLDTVGFGGGDGTLMTQFAPGPDGSSHNTDIAEAVAIQTDGDIVAAGTGDPTINMAENEEDFAVARYNSDGGLDGGFGGDGKVTTDIFSNDSTDLAHGLALLPGNKILVVGSAQKSLGAGLTLVQYEDDGDPDPTFDGNGIRTRNFTGVTDELHGVARQADGKLVTVGKSGDNFIVARFNANGSDDNSFDGNGYITTTFTPVSPTASSGATSRSRTAARSSPPAVPPMEWRRQLRGRALPRERSGRPQLRRPLLRRAGNRLRRRLRRRRGARDRLERQARRRRLRRPRLRRYPLPVRIRRARRLQRPRYDHQGPEEDDQAAPYVQAHIHRGRLAFQCRINGRNSSKPFFPCISPYKIQKLKLGPTRLEVRAIDKAGNKDPSPAFLKIKRIRRR